MRKHIVAAALIGAFVTPALALTAGTYYVGLDTTTPYMLGGDRDGPRYENDGKI
jgi:hypothetical protein